MSLQMSKLLDYEKKILENRRELQELTRQQGLMDDEAMKNKLKHFEDELHYMESQLGFLKADLERKQSLQSVKQASMEPASVMVEVQPENALHKEVVRATTEQQEASPLQIQAEPQAQVRPQTQVKQPPTKPKRSEGLEKTIGKSIMGIAASVLIFISFILFATLLLPYFNDTAKMVTTYLISGAFLGIGLWKLDKQKDNKFYLALTGCGFGALYISLLLSNMYFKAINDLVLFILIAIWAMGACVVSKLKNPIFQIIGQLGIFISLVFGVILCEGTQDVAKFGALVIFYIVTSTVFYAAHFQKEFSKNTLHHVFHTLSFIVLLIGCAEVLEGEAHWITILVIAFIAVHMGICVCCSREDRDNGVGVFLGMYTFVAFVLFAFLGIEGAIVTIILYAVSMALMILILMKKKIGLADRNFAIFVYVCLAIFFVAANEWASKHGLVPMVVLPFLILGYVKKNALLKYSSMFMFFIFLCAFDESCWEGFFLGTAVVATAFVLLYKFKDQYSIGLKYIIHILSVLFLASSVDCIVNEIANSKELAELWAYVVAVLFNIIMMKSCFGKNLENGNEENAAVYNLINLICMIVGIELLENDLGAVAHFVVIVFALLTFTVNAKNLLDKREHAGWGIYVGIKYTILLVNILNSFEAVNYVISITCFVFAILSIVIGFWKKYSSLRVFGLALSMISTFKLIMVDIYYSNTFGHALSFFGSGLLCFVISMIYNQVDKKMKEEEEMLEA